MKKYFFNDWKCFIILKEKNARKFNNISTLKNFLWT